MLGLNALRIQGSGFRVFRAKGLGRLLEGLALVVSVAVWVSVLRGTNHANAQFYTLCVPAVLPTNLLSNPLQRSRVSLSTALLSSCEGAVSPQRRDAGLP